MMGPMEDTLLRKRTSYKVLHADITGPPYFKMPESM
jgi:hypothetical protein